MKTLFSLFSLPLFILGALQPVLAQSVKLESNYYQQGQLAVFSWDIQPLQIQMGMSFTAEGEEYSTIFTYQKGGTTLQTQTFAPSGNYSHNVNISDILEDPDLQESDFKVDFSEETKEILGHECIKIIITGSKASGEAWLARDLEIDLSGFAIMFQADPILEAIATNGIKGFPLESKTYDWGGNVKAFHKVSRVD